MSILSICLLSILLPIAFFLLLFLVYLLLKLYFQKKYDDYSNNLNNFLTNEPYIDLLTILRTVDKALQEKEKLLVKEISNLNNDEIEKKSEELNKITNDKNLFATQKNLIEDKIKKIKNLNDELVKKLKNFTIFSCKKIITEIEKIKMEINTIKDDVSNKSKDIINTINDFDKEKFKYEKIFRKLKDQIDVWKEKVNSDLFDNSINTLEDQVNQNLEEASNKISIGDKNEAFRFFTLFKKKLFDIINFANYFEKFYEILFTKAQQSFEKVKNYLESVKNELNLNLSDLNINLHFSNVNDKLAQAKEFFYNLKIDETIDSIENYYSSLVNLTYIIRTEINAYNFFNSYNIIELSKESIIFIEEKYKNLNEECNKLLYIDNMFYENIKKQIEEIELSINQIKNQISELNILIDDKNVSYSTKQNKIRNIFILMKNLYLDLYESERSINTFYTEGVSQGLKYHRLKKIYIEGLADINKYRIKLNIEDKEYIDSIEVKKNIIESKIINLNYQNEKEMEEDINKFYNLIKKFVLETIQKIVLLKCFSLINTEYSYKRLTNNIYDKKIMECEELIKEGKYRDGITNLINVIKGENN